MNLLDLLRRPDDIGSVLPNWTPGRAQFYERETFKYLGVRESAFPWSHQFRPVPKELSTTIDYTGSER